MNKTQPETSLAARTFFTKFYEHVADLLDAALAIGIFDFCNWLPRVKPQQAYIPYVPDEFPLSQRTSRTI